jgi:hypothetical protein
VSWQSERQQCEAICALLARVHLGHLWTATGPTEEACRLLEAKGGYLSHGQALMLQVGFDIWNGCGHATVGDLIGVLDGGNLLAVGSLLVELSNPSPDIDSWLEDVGMRDELARKVPR